MVLNSIAYSRGTVMLIRRIIMLITLTLAFTCMSGGCSGGGSPVVPDDTAVPDGLSVTGQNTSPMPVSNTGSWGWWDVTFDTRTLEFEVIPTRSPEFTCNVTQFLHPPVSPVHLVSFSIDAAGSDFASGLFDVAVTLRHPFPGLAQYRGFDVRGIFIADLGTGLITDEHDPSLEYNGPEGPKLLNPDGYTRWWNYQEFSSYGTIFGYTAPPFAIPPTAQWHSDLNPYKYFADELSDSDEMVLEPEQRGTFSTQPGINSREYLIQFGMDGSSPVVEFSYAVCASWDPPDDSYEPDYPLEAYSLNANAQEAYQINAMPVNNTLWYEDDTNLGGGTMLQVEVRDWQSTENPDGTPGEVAGIYLSSDIGGIDGLEISSLATPTPGSGPTSSVWTVDLADLEPYAPVDGMNSILITVESSNPNSYAPDIPNPEVFDWPDAPLAAYQWFYIPIGTESPQPTIVVVSPNGGEVLTMGEDFDIEWTAPGTVTEVMIEYSKDGFVADINEIAASTPNDGTFMWEVPADPSETVRVRISEVGNPDNFDISDEDFTITGDCEPTFTLLWSYDCPGNGYVDSRIAGSPVIVDLDDDGTCEVLAYTSTTYTLHCFDHEGNLEWTPFQCPSPVSSWYGSPAVGEFNGDGVLDIVISNTDQSGSAPNRLYVVDGATGAEIFNIASADIFESMPSLADVVGATASAPPDGQLDIIVGRNDSSSALYTACYNGLDGNLVWQAQREYYSMGTPALADMDYDGDIDVVGGSGLMGEGPLYRGIYALQGDGVPTGNRTLWEANYGTHIWAPASLHDYNDDDIPDVIVGDHATTSTSTIRCLDGSSGSTMWQHTIYSGLCSPALGDLNSDGYPDVVVAPPYDHIVAINGDPDASDRVLWDWTDPSSYYLDTRSSMVLYDVTCDGVPDVIAGMRYTPPGGNNPGVIWIIDGATGEEIVSQDIPSDQVSFGAPAVGDVDGDGDVEVVVGTYDDSVVYCYSLGTPVPSEFSARPWPMYMGNIRNTGLYGDEF